MTNMINFDWWSYDSQRAIPDVLAAGAKTSANVDTTGAIVVCNFNIKYDFGKRRDVKKHRRMHWNWESPNHTLIQYRTSWELQRQMPTFQQMPRQMQQMPTRLGAIVVYVGQGLCEGGTANTVPEIHKNWAKRCVEVRERQSSLSVFSTNKVSKN